MFDFILKGGPVMIPIILGSIVGLAIVIERGWVWWHLRLDAAQFSDEIMGLVRTGRVAEALNRCRAVQHPLARVLAAGLEHASWELPEVERLMQHEGDCAVQQLERHLGGLSSIISIEPLLGFLGTITGLIHSFRAWEHAGADVTVSTLAAGIYEAMITTAAGLIVAIPLYLANNYFLFRIKRCSFEATDAGNALLRTLAQSREAHTYGASANVSVMAERDPTPSL